MIAPWRDEPAEKEDLADRIYQVLCSKSVVSMLELLVLVEKDAAVLSAVLVDLMAEKKISELRPLHCHHANEFIYYRRRQDTDTFYQRQHEMYQRALAAPRKRKHIDPL